MNKLLLLSLGLFCILQFTLASKKHCPDRCSYHNCGKGKNCVWNKDKCKAECVCSLTCATVLCAYGNCVQDPKTCQVKCVCPTICTKEYIPVCGSDGKTYGNACELNGASCTSQEKGGKPITKKSDGKCPCQSVCTKNYCGPRRKCIWDPKNCKATCPCRRSCKRVRCKNKARCFQDKNTCRRFCKCSRACPKIYRPVCGSNGRTYANQCLLNYATCRSKGKITKKSDGRCPCKITCANFRCGKGARCVHNPRTCKTQCVCSKACPKIYKPVCGTDGVTYDNECLLNYQFCKTKGKVDKKKDGKCCSVDCSTVRCSYRARCVHDPLKCITKCVCSNICTKIYKPVCGTDGKTYGNECQLNYVFCKTKGKIRKKSDGRCPRVCPHHNPCAGIRCGYGKRCVPNFSRCAYSCQPKVCPNRQCVQPACDAKPCKKGQRCIEICKNSCVHACEISRYRRH